jgi:hypothetical protein
MKFLDLKPGMTVIFNTHDSARWANFHEQFIRNPHYNDSESWYKKHYKKYENLPITVREIANVPGDSEWPGEERYNILRATTPTGDKISLSEHWFNPADENAFKQILPAAVREEIKKVPAKQAKDIAMGELRAVPGSVDYEAAKSRFGKGRTRRSRRSRKTRKVRRSRR